MATTSTSKKTGASKTATSNSRKTTTSKTATKTPAKSAAKTTTRANARQKPPEKTPAPFRREVGAVVCLALAIFVGLGYFGVEALFLDFAAILCKGLLGCGYWLVAPVLLLAVYILGFHRGRPVRGRLICALCIPSVFACLWHGLVAEMYSWNLSILSNLWADGQQYVGGGVLGGLVGQIFVQCFSVVGSTIVFVVVIFLLILCAFHRSVMDIVDWVQNRPQYEYSYEDDYDDEEDYEPAPAPVRRRATIDIPVDEPPVKQEKQQAEEPKEKKAGGFFSRKPRVPTPAEALAATAATAATAVTATTAQAAVDPLADVEETPFTSPVVESSQPVVTPLVEETVAATVEEVLTPAPPTPLETEPVQKLKKGETAQAAQEVAEDIAQTMSHASGDQPYKYPPLSLLKESGTGDMGGVQAELAANKQRLADTIRSFNIVANIVSVTRGPSVTRYELELDQGVRLNKLTNLADDIALALGATGVRIAPIPDQISMVGIEVPNKLVTPVSIHEVIGSSAFTSSGSKVSFSVGKDIGGNEIVGNIAKLPHLLIAGTTGSGKSVCTNSLIISLLYKATPEEVRLIMVDPKMVELGIYNGIPHLLIPVVTDPKKAAGALQWAVTEMMKRYRSFSEVGVRDLASYNALAAKTEGMEKMPQIVVVIDELADLMLVAAKEVEESICRVAQMGRASGMHLIIATQRPSADVITGLMKANIPSRIAFAVASAMESRIILDTQGAEKLVGRGDMLYAPLGVGKPQRIQGCFISDPEVAAVVDFVKQSGGASYNDEIIHEIERNAAEKDKNTKNTGGGSAAGGTDGDGGDYDELIDAAAEVVLDTKQASVSMLQRRLKLGYARAARLVDQLEEKGIVGPFEGSKPRQLLITKEQWQERQYRNGVGTPAPAAPADTAPAGEIPPFDVEEAMSQIEDEGEVF